MSRKVPTASLAVAVLAALIIGSVSGVATGRCQSAGSAG